MTQVFGKPTPDTRTALDTIRAIQRTYDENAGIIQGPFEDCDCLSHHQHGANGPAGCPVCNPPETLQ